MVQLWLAADDDDDDDDIWWCVPVGQPGQRPALQFMAAPAAMPGVPPGLEYLAQIDQLLVHQQIEIFERLYWLIDWLIDLCTIDLLMIDQLYLLYSYV